jgi:hypothetical protein
MVGDAASDYWVEIFDVGCPMIPSVDVPCKAAISKVSRNGDFTFTTMAQGEFPPQHKKFFILFKPKSSSKNEC